MAATVQADVPVTPEGSRSPTLERAIVWSAGSLATYLALAVVAAVIGVLSGLVAGSMAVGVGVAWVFVARRVQHPTLVRLPLWAVVAVGVVAIALTALNVVHGAEHYLNDRDPGVYLTTAQWVRSEGSLVFDGALGPFSGIEGVNAEWVGFYPAPGGHQYAQFSHGLPVLLASVGFVGGTGAMLGLNAVVGGLSVILLAVLIGQTARPAIAAVLACLAGVSLSFLYFVRDTYSEPLVVLLVLLSLLNLSIASKRGESMALVSSGFAIGATAIVRIDGWMLVVGWIVLMASWVVASRRPALADSAHERAMLAMISIAFVGVADLALRSPDYVMGRRSQVVMLGMAVVASLVGWLVVFRARSSLRRMSARIPSGVVSRVRIITGCFVGAILVVGLTLRPWLTIARSGWSPFKERLTAEAGLIPDGTRTFGELTLVWFTWYWGWLAVLAAIVGVVVIFARRSEGPTAAAALVVCGFAAAVYLVRPSILPDHVWAMRRFMPSASIALPIAAAAASEWILLRMGRANAHRFVISMVAAIALIAVVVPVGVTVSPLISYAHQSGLRNATDDLCASLPQDAAVLVADDWLGTRYAATILAHCDVPTASTDTRDRLDLERIGLALWQAGSVPVIVTAEPIGIEGSVVSSGAIRYPVADDPVLHPPRVIGFLSHRWHAVAVSPDR